MTKNQNRIFFDTSISLDGLEKIIVKKGEKKKLIQQLIEERIPLPRKGQSWKSFITEVSPFFADMNDQDNFRSFWLEPASTNSEDIVRWAIHDESRTFEELIDLFLREYPQLQVLFLSHVSPNDPDTVKTRTCRVLQAFEKHKNSYSFQEIHFKKERLVKTIKMAFLFHTVASPVLTTSEKKITTLAILSTALDRFGFERKEIRLAQSLVENELFFDLVDPQSQISLEESFSHFQEYAEHAELDLKSYFDLQLLFFTCQATTSPYLPENIFQETSGHIEIVHPNIQLLGQMIQQHEPKDSILAKGVSTLDLFNTYIWEKVDPKHRYGASVQKERDRYERLILENPYWDWKGNFWQWLDKKSHGTRMSHIHFFTPEQREKAKIQFSNGKVIFPEDEELQSHNLRMFVVGLDGEPYMAIKHSGEGEAKPGTSHGSFFSCGPVLSAGKLLINADGIIEEITNHSGHYKPGPHETAYFLELLQQKGVSLRGVKLLIKFPGKTGKNKTFPDAALWLESWQKKVNQDSYSINLPK